MKEVVVRTAAPAIMRIAGFQPRRGSRSPGRAGRGSAFTLVELLVVLAILAVLASLLLPALASGKQRGRTIQCLNNARQLSTAWMLYAEDHNGALVPNCDGSNSGKNELSPSWAGGWLDFGSRMDNFEVRYLIDPDFQFGGRLGPYLQSPALFKCPSDRSQVTVFGRAISRVRTYSINSYLNGIGSGRPLGSWQNREFVTFRKLNEIIRPSPAATFVLIDEREDSINDGYFAFDMGKQVIVDYPASYHSRAANLNFADGHSEVKRWLDPRTRPPLKPGELIPLNQPSPDNPDVIWLQERTTARAL